MKVFMKIEGKVWLLVLGLEVAFQAPQVKYQYYTVQDDPGPGLGLVMC